MIYPTTEHLVAESNKLRELALKNYDIDEGVMYECTDEEGYQAMVKEYGSADAAWAAHIDILPARREAGGYYEKEKF